MFVACGFTLIYEPWRVLVFGYHKLRIKRTQRLVLPKNKWFFIACIRNDTHIYYRCTYIHQTQIQHLVYGVCTAQLSYALF